MKLSYIPSVLKLKTTIYLTFQQMNAIIQERVARERYKVKALRGCPLSEHPRKIMPDKFSMPVPTDPDMTLL
jgi:hypothetical protein